MKAAMTSCTPKIALIVICGPTGIGKTLAAIELAEAFNGEIVGADSMQVYRHMDIGTAKPTPEEQRRVPHHLIDVADPDEPFDAARFSTLARKAASALAGQGKLPVVAGGTGLYIRAMLHGLFEAQPSDRELRETLNRQAEAEGTRALHQRLAAVDPQTAQRIHPNDRIRVLRALEIFTLTGVPLSEHHRGHAFSDSPYAVLKIGLTMDRPALYRRIEQRVEAMMALGLEEEVRRLLEMGYGPQLKPMQAIGYRHMVDRIEGRLSRKEAVETLKRDTRRFAKRQFTWFNADPDIRWYEPSQIEAMRSAVGAFLAAWSAESKDDLR